MVRKQPSITPLSSLTIADLERLLAERKAAVAGLTERRGAIADELATINAQIYEAIGTGSVRLNRKPGPRGPGRPPKDEHDRPEKAKQAAKSSKHRGRAAGAKGQSDLHNAIRSALTGATGPMKAVDIAKAVLARGYETKSKVFHLIIGQRLAEMADVVKPERGLYALK